MTIQEEILDFANRHRKFKTSDVVRGLKGKYSRAYTSGILTSLYKKGRLLRSGSGPKVFYVLPENAGVLADKVHRRLRNEDLKEHEVIDNLTKQTPFLINLKDNVRSIFDYAFSEMLNNAIEHSHSKWIDVDVSSDKRKLSFVVRDYGIGVFKSIMKKRSLSSELEGIQDLMKGKVTTQPHSHSGEGIFFTSKVSDVFTLESFGYYLKIDNDIGDIFVGEIKRLSGTKASSEISIKSKKHLIDTFKEFQIGPGSYAFDKTKVHVKLYRMGTIHVSRSQARRILVDLDKFKLVILDFDQVSTIGQAFADEIFRVFTISHPNIKIKPVNMNDAVRFMVERVEKT